MVSSSSAPMQEVDRLSDRINFLDDLVARLEDRIMLSKLPLLAEKKAAEPTSLVEGLKHRMDNINARLSYAVEEIARNL